MTRYKLRFSNPFLRHFRKIRKKSPKLACKVENILDKMMDDPFDPSLNTHKAGTRQFGQRWSSRVTGDIRIIWDFTEGDKRLLILTIGGHSGKRGIY